jgi:hypothetical protein
VLLSDGVVEPLPDLRVGRFRIRTFHNATEAAEWLHPDTRHRTPSLYDCRQRQQFP